MQTAYMAGHWRRFDEVKDDLPYLMYDAINDSRTRPSHLAMDGVIRPVGDPIWKRWTPPCGHRCRCTLRQVSSREAQRRGGVTQSIPAEAVPDEGWGGDPRQWGGTLLRIVRQRQAACGLSSAGFARGKRPVSRNMDCTPAGARILEMAANPQTALLLEFARRAASMADRQIVHEVGAVDPALVAHLPLRADLAGAARLLDNYAVRHILKKHGNATAEAARGQIAVTIDDFALIPLMVSQPDAVWHGGLSKIGRETIVYAKLIDGIGYLYVEEVRTGRNALAAVSLRKKKGAWTAP